MPALLHRLPFRYLWASFAVMLCAAVVLPARATQPLHDHYETDSRSGQIFPERCCWIKLPPSSRLKKFRRAQQCTAIGGPVGMFRYEDGKLWLTGLDACGPVDAKVLYPNLTFPVVADWLSGTFTAYIGFRCKTSGQVNVYEAEQVLVVVRGAVKSVAEAPGDLTLCAE